MVFSSLLFIFGFLPLLYFLYYLAPRAARNYVLLTASLLLYTWGAPRFILIFLTTCWIDFKLAKRLADGSSSNRKQILWASIILDVGQLAYFKYAGFAIDQANGLVSLLGLHPFTIPAIVLPIGISFITFEKISYTVDVYVGRVRPADKFSNYLLFLALFPHLIAGPIFRYHDIAPQLDDRKWSSLQVAQGIERFCFGMARKVLIADPVAVIADWAFKQPPSSLTAGYAWLGAIAYAVQIYFDFSGYSDMAIGLGKMFGFEFVENFNRPYTAKSITEFWRRWHISLGNWMREYLYIPLGGNKGSVNRTYVNLWIVFLLSGLWHGAAWTFVFWGAFHGSFLVLERSCGGAPWKKLPGAIQQGFTFVIVLVGWILFRAPNLVTAKLYLLAMLGLAETPQERLLSSVINNRTASVLVLAAIGMFITLRQNGNEGESSVGRLDRALGFTKRPIALTALVLAILALVNSEFHPFIYFRF